VKYVSQQTKNSSCISEKSKFGEVI